MPRRPSSRLPRIPEMTVRRLSVYTRCLLQLEEDGVKTVSSQDLAERFNLNSAQVRKDLAYFGEFGVRGIDYYVSSLKAELQRILGLDREWPVALVGFGNLGSALFHYRGFGRQGFRIAVIFDDDPADRKSTRLNSSHLVISYAVFCLKKKKIDASACIARLN